MKNYYYRYIICDGSGAEVSRDYHKKEDAEFDMTSYKKLYSGCYIKKRRYYYT